MARRPRLPLNDVRSLTLREILHRWRAEAEFPPRTLERELRRFVVNSDLDWRAGERINPNTPDDDLPGLDTLVDRNFIEVFCEKKGFPLPTFWFPPDPAEVARPGRPSQRAAIVQGFEDRIERGETADTISAEARAISAALAAKGFEGLPEPKTIQGHIRGGYRAWKARQNL